jgi:nucleotide-binding universal stress UspA family protein
MPDPIIVGADGSSGALAAVEWAADDAARRECPLRVVCVVDRLAYGIVKFPTTAGDPLTMHAEQALADAEAAARTRQPGLEISTEIIEGLPAKVLRDKAKEATEIVVGSRGLGGFAGILIGSVSTHVAGHVHGPVVVVRAGWKDVHDEIVVGVDGSDACEPAMSYAFAEARLRRSALRAVYAWQLPVHVLAPEVTYDLDEVREAQQRVVSDKLGAWRIRYPDVTVREDVVCAHPVDVLTEASESADLLEVGSHGRGALGSVVLGSVSRGVLHHAHCPVAVVRS